MPNPRCDIPGNNASAGRRLEATARGPVEFPEGMGFAARWRWVVERFGERVAVEWDLRRLTYHSLNRDAERVAARVRSLVESGRTGDGTGFPVIGFVGDIATEFITFQVGVLLGGAAWMYLDPRREEFRRPGVLRALGLSLVVEAPSGTGESGRAPCPWPGVPIVRWEDWMGESSPGPSNGTSLRPGDTGAGAIFLTSGSTGTPKVVWYPADAIVRDIGRQTRTLRLSFGDRVDLLFSPSFSACLASIYDALLNGGTLCPRDPRTEGVAGLGRWLRERGITLSTLSVSTLRALLHGEAGAPASRGRSDWPALRVVSTGGEPLLADDVRRFQRLFGPAVVLQNAYASTELRTVCEWFVHAGSPEEPGVQSVGWAVAGRRLWLQDEAGREVTAFGELGEVIVEGVGGVSWDTTGSERVEGAGLNPGRVAEGGRNRTHRTGDMGWRDAVGRLHLAGRLDDVVKVRGQRVALGEVEAEVRAQCPGWEVKAEWVTGQLVLGVEEAASQPGFPAGRLEALPERLRPARIVRLDVFPRTHSGKVDRVALRAILAGNPRQPGASGALGGNVAIRGQGDRGDGLVEVCRIVGDVLERPGLSVDADLAREGGPDSLQWAVILMRLETLSGRWLAPGALSGCRTVRSLAERLANLPRDGPEDGIGVTTLTAGEADGPQYVHFSAHSDWREFCQPLVDGLGPAWGVRVLHFAATGLSPGRRRTMAELAAACVERVKGAVPGGGRLGMGGFCLGGLVAHEVAALLGCGPGGRPSRWADLRVTLLEAHTYARRKHPLLRLWEDVRRIQWRHFARLSRPGDRGAMVRRVLARHRPGGGAREAMPTGDWESDASLEALMKGYVPAHRAGGVQLVFGAVRRPEIERRSAFHLESDWERFVAGEVERTLVEGADHWTLLKSHAREAARSAAAYLRAERGTVGGGR